jgi:hypothetical protein
MPQLADFGGFYYDPASYLFSYLSCCDGRDMSTVPPTIAQSANTRQWIRCRVVAKSAGSEDPVFTSMIALLYEA